MWFCSLTFTSLQTHMEIPSPRPTPKSHRRRAILGFTGVGALSAVMAALGWKLAKERGFTLAGTTSRPAQNAGNDGAEQIQRVQPTSAERDAFLPHLRTEFQIREERSGQARAILTDVSPLQISKSHLGTFAGFSLLFEAPPAFLSEGGLCVVNHDKMGQMSFFLSPIGRDKEVRHLEAVFSHRI